MKPHFLKFITSLLFTLFLLPSFAQTNKKPVGDEILKVYKDKGIEKAIATYYTLKKKDKDEYIFDESQLNSVGYIIMNEHKKPADAKKIFWLNMEEYPHAVNPNDSYGDVLVALGEKEEAKKYYQKAIDTYNRQNAFEKNVVKSSKAKLAVLNNKNKQLSFMEGDWDVEYVWWNNNGQEMKDNGEVEVNYVNDLVLVAKAKDVRGDAGTGIPGPVSIITYDAQNDDYDMVNATPVLEGLYQSSMKLTKPSANKIVMVEEVNDDGTEMVFKHELEPKGNSIIWTTYTLQPDNQYKKVAVRNMRKK